MRGFRRRAGARIARWTGLFALALALSAAACSNGTDESVTATNADGSPTAAVTEASVDSTAAAETETPTATPQRSVEVVDSSSETLTFEAPVSRIVSHSPGATEILFAIGAGEQVVAADQFSNYPAEADALPEVAYSSPDPERDLSFDPDLVIFASNQEESLAHFRDLGMRVLFLREPVDIDGIYENIRLLARVTGHEQSGESLVAEMQEQLAGVTAVLEAVEDGPRVFYEITDGLFTVSPDSFIGAALSILKVRNIAEGAGSAFPQLSSEAVVEADPEVILMADADFVPPESVPERPGWAGMTAVVEGRIYPVDGDIMSRPGPRIVEGIESLARLLYPDLFE